MWNTMAHGRKSQGNSMHCVWLGWSSFFSEQLVLCCGLGSEQSRAGNTLMSQCPSWTVSAECQGCLLSPCLTVTRLGCTRDCEGTQPGHDLNQPKKCSMLKNVIPSNKTGRKGLCRLIIFCAGTGWELVQPWMWWVTALAPLVLFFSFVLPLLLCLLNHL